jgi:hypothetical protein
MTIDHRREMGPPIVTTRDVRHIHRPPFITPSGSTHPATRPGTRRGDALMHKPPVLLQHAIDRFPIHHEAVLVS